MRKLSFGLSFVAMVLLAACGSESGTEVSSDLPPGFSKPSSERSSSDGGSDNSGESSASGNKVSSASEETSSSSAQYSFSSEKVVHVDSSTVVTGTMTDERDGQTYKTVKIGNQTWMAENLNYRYLGPTVNLDSSSFCNYNDAANCTKYGRLYLWSAAMDSAGIIDGNTANGCGYYSECSPGGTVRGVCPKGWHLPSKSEWDELITAVGNSSVAGKMLKSETGWQSYLRVENTDAYLFSALPADYRYGSGSYGEGYYAYFWSFTESSSNLAYGMNLYYNEDDAYLKDFSKNFGFSVRCLKD